MSSRESIDFIFRGVDELTGKARTIGTQMNRELTDLQQRQFQAGASGRQMELRALDEHYSQVRSRAQKHFDALSRAESAALTGGFNASMKGGDSRNFDRQAQELGGQRARVADVLGQAAKSEQAERASLQQKWEAEDAAMAKTHADQRTADVQRLEGQIFTATHSARDRELQDVRTRSAALRAQYQGDAEMHAKIAESEQSEVAAINERYQERGLKRLLSPRNLHHLLGGFVATAGLGMALGAEKAVFAGQEANDLAANRGAKMTDVVAARLAANEAVGNIGSVVPVFGPVFKMFHDLATNREGLERLGPMAEKAAAGVDHLGQITAQAAGKIAAGLAALYGYTGAESAYKGAQRAGLERQATLHQGWEDVMAAETALSAAKSAGAPRTSGSDWIWSPTAFVRKIADEISPNLGLAVPQAQRLADQAGVRRLALLSLQQEDARIEAQRVEQERVRDSNQFNRGLTFRQYDADRMGQYETPAVRHARERFQLGMRHQADLEQFSGLDRREAKLGNEEKWRKDWTEIELPLRMNADSSQIEADVRAKLQGESSGAYRTERGFLYEQRQREKDMRRIQGLEVGGLDRQETREKLEAFAQAEIVRLGANPLQSASRARERMENEISGRTEAPEIATAKKLATEDRFRLEDEDRERKHLHTMADAQADASTGQEERRKREFDRIREGYDEELRKFKDNAEEKARIEAEIAVKQDAVTMRQKEDRQQSRMGLRSGALRLAGGVFSDIAEQLDLKEKYRRMRREFAGRPGMLGLLDPMENAERSELLARESWLPHEVAARRMGGDAGRPSGFDNPTLLLTQEMRQLREWLVNKFGDGGIVKVEAFQ